MDRFQHQCAECAGLGSGRSVSDDFIAVVDGYWFRDGISDWKERRGTVYDPNKKDYGPSWQKAND